MVSQARGHFEHIPDFLPANGRRPPTLIRDTGDLIEIPANGTQLGYRALERQ